MASNFLRAALAALWLVSCCAGQGNHDVRLGPETVWGSLEDVDAQLPFHRWSQGHLLAWSKRPASSPVVDVYDSRAQLVRSITLAIPGAATTSITGVDLAKDGSLVVAGISTQADGAKARYLALVSPRGELSRLVRTGAYLAHYVCADEDRTVWTVGDEWTGPGRVKESGYSVLRQYSFSAGLLREPVDRDQIKGRVVSWGGQVYSAFLTCSGNRVRFLSVISQQWFEYNRQTGMVTEGDLDESARAVTGLAVTKQGRALVSIVERASPRGPRIFEVAPAESQDRDRRFLLRPVPGTACDADSACIWNLLAREGESLITVRAGPDGRRLYSTVVHDN